MGRLEVYGEVGRAEGVSGEEAEVVLKGAWKRLAWKNTRERGNENQRPWEGPLWTHPSLLAPRGSAGETEAWPSAELISAAWPLPSTLPTLDGPHSRVVWGKPVWETGFCGALGWGQVTSEEFIKLIHSQPIKTDE